MRYKIVDESKSARTLFFALYRQRFWFCRWEYMTYDTSHADAHMKLLALTNPPPPRWYYDSAGNQIPEDHT